MKKEKLFLFQRRKAVIRGEQKMEGVGIISENGASVRRS